jgi:hypothetical protein
MQRFEAKIAEFEKQADDPWKEAKQLIRHWGRDDLMLDNNGRLLQQVALYVYHLEEKAKQLESTAIPAEVFNRAALQRRIKHQRRELKRLNNAMKQWAAKAFCNPAVVLALVAEVERLRDRLEDLVCSGCDQQPKFCSCEVEQPEASNADQA